MSYSEAGKGSRPRPFSVSHEEWATRWDAIFGRDLEKLSEEVNESNTVNSESNLNHNKESK